MVHSVEGRKPLLAQASARYETVLEELASGGKRRSLAAHTIRKSRPSGPPYNSSHPEWTPISLHRPVPLAYY
jgi:hypothetical protein